METVDAYVKLAVWCGRIGAWPGYRPERADAGLPAEALLVFEGFRWVTLPTAEYFASTSAGRQKAFAGALEAGGMRAYLAWYKYGMYQHPVSADASLLDAWLVATRTANLAWLGTMLEERREEFERLLAGAPLPAAGLGG